MHRGSGVSSLSFVSGSSPLFSGRSQACGQMHKHALHSHRKTNSQEDPGQKVMQIPSVWWEPDKLQYDVWVLVCLPSAVKQTL